MELSASTPSSPRRSDRPRRSRGLGLSKCGRFLLMAATAAAMSSNFVFAQQQPNDDRCKAEDANRQTDNKQVESGQASPAPDGNPSQKLADCGGVLKPPAVGDNKMEKPAPKVGNTPVIKPGDQQKEQQNGQQPDK